MANEKVSQGSFSDFYQGAASGDSRMVNMLAYYLGMIGRGGFR
jgi:hypothetical protein